MISYETFVHVKDEVHSDEMGQIHVRGISEPVATYRVVDRHANMPERTGSIQLEIPYMKIDLQPGKMSPEQRKQAFQTLNDALIRLSE